MGLRPASLSGDHFNLRLHIRVQAPLPEPVRRVLFAGVCATYAKLFLRCHGVGSLPDNVVPAQHLQHHKQLLDLRHKALAHLDALNFQADDPQIGNLNEVRLILAKGQYPIEIRNLSPDTLKPTLTKALCRELLDKCDYHIGKFTRKYAENTRLGSGEYKLTIDPKDQVPFIPVKPIYPRLALAFEKGR